MTDSGNELHIYCKKKSKDIDEAQIKIAIKQNLILDGRIKFKNHIFVKQNDSLILQSFIMNSVALTIRIKFSVVSFYHLMAVEPPLSKL